MLDAAVFSLGVFSDEDRIYVVVGRLVAGDRFARTDIGEEVEGSSKCKIERNMTLPDRCLITNEYVDPAVGIVDLQLEGL